MTKGSKTVKADETLLAIIEQLKNQHNMGVTEIANGLGVAKSTVHSHLATLENKGYIVKKNDRYQLGFRFLNIGMAVKNGRLPDEKIRSAVEELADETGERAQFVVEENGRGFYVHTVSGDLSIRADATVGNRIHLHTSAAGKAILAQFPNQHVDRIIDMWGLPKKTEQTISDREKLFDELDLIRERGVAFNQEEHITGLRGIGTAVKQPDGGVLGALSVAIPTHRVPDEQFEHELPEAVLGVGNMLELKMQHGE